MNNAGTGTAVQVGSRWKPYPAYKDSGVEWLGEIPTHWEVKRLRFIASSIQTGPFGSQLHSEEYITDGTPIINPANIQNGKIVPDLNCTVDAPTQGRLSRHELRQGDVVFARRGEMGRCALVTENEEGWLCGTGSLTVRPETDTCHPPYLSLVLSIRGMKDWLSLESVGSTMENLNTEILSRAPIPNPSLSEQRAIASFLDHETAHIDTLITKKERLIELLTEERTALISHAVTKGLDPTVPMKDSGVEWLGAIPAHWGVIQSRRVFKVRNEPTLESDEQLTASQKYGMLPQTEFMELEGRRVVVTIQGVESLRHVEPNDFVISLRSFQGGIEWCKLRGSVTFHYVVLKPVKTLHPAYFGYLFKSSVFIQALRATTDFIRDGQDLRYSHFVLVPLPVVPMDEQAAIATYLDRETAKIDALITKIRTHIDNLKEYRTALISAAVTGKIDVREEVA